MSEGYDASQLGPLGGPQSPTAQVQALQGGEADPQFALMQLLQAIQGMNAGGAGGVAPAIGSLPGVNSNYDPRLYAPLMQALAQQGYSTPPVISPANLRQQLYPMTQPGNGPYIQWMGGSMQEPKWDKTLAAASMLHNLLAGWAQGRHQAQAGTQLPLPTQE